MLLLELLESKATQADTNLLESMTADVNWNRDFETFQITGNFALAGHNFIYLWQSFNHPIDTILPTQILNQGSKLVARFSKVLG